MRIAVVGANPSERYRIAERLSKKYGLPLISQQIDFCKVVELRELTVAKAFLEDHIKDQVNYDYPPRKPTLLRVG